MEAAEWDCSLGTEMLKLVKQVEERDGLPSACLAKHRQVNRVTALKDGGEVRADFPDLVVTDQAVEDLGQDRKLAFARKLFVIQICRVDDDGVACGYVDLFANLGLNGVLQLKYTSQWNVGKGFYKRLSRPWPVVTAGRRWE